MSMRTIVLFFFWGNVAFAISNAAAGNTGLAIAGWAVVLLLSWRLWPSSS
jgi:hypothetical protein